MKNLLSSGLARKAMMFAFVIGIVSPSALASYQITPLNQSSYTVSGLNQSTYNVSGIGNQVAAVAPQVQALSVTPDSYNPATGNATVSFSLNTSAQTTVWIKDANDVVVKTLLFDTLLNGGQLYSYPWNGKDSNGNNLPTGNYKASIVAYNTVDTDVATYNFVVNSTTTVTAPNLTSSVSPQSFNPGLGEAVTVSYGLNVPANLSVLVKSGSTTVKTLRAFTASNGGSNSYSWDGRNESGQLVANGNYTVEVYASNAGGNDIAVSTVTVTSTPVVNAPDVTVSVSTAEFNPSQNQSVTINYGLSTAANLRLLVKSGSTTIRTLRAASSASAGQGSVVWDGRNDAGQIVTAGSYTVEAYAYNIDGSDTAFANVAVVSSQVVTAPVLSNVYVDPYSFNPNNQNAKIYFTVDKNATISVTVKSGSTVIRNLVSNSTYNAGSYFQEWNGRNNSGSVVANGSYTVEVTASNSAGSVSKTAGAEVTGGSTGTCSVITSAYSNPTSFNPNERETLITFSTNQTATVSLRIKKSSAVIRTLLNSQTISAGSRTYSWNGRDNNGNFVDQGTYTYEVAASVSGCADDYETGSMTVTGTGYDSQNDWPSTDENLITNVLIDNEVFNPEDGERVRVSFNLNDDADLLVQVMDGNSVIRTLRDGKDQSQGTYSYYWDGRDQSGRIVSDDLYQIRIMADNGPDSDTDRTYTEVDTDGVIIGFPTDQRCAGFRDVSVHSPFCKAIELMSSKHIFDGYSDGTFRPYLAINRAETTKVVTLALGYDVPTGGYFGRQFTDTLANAWYAKYLETAIRNHIINGYPDGSFRPNNTINRVELLKIFLRANNVGTTNCSTAPFLDTPINADTNWYMPYACYAKMNGLMNSGYSQYLYPDKPMTRGDVADLFYDFETRGLYNGNGSANCYDYGCDNYSNDYNYNYSNYYGYNTAGNNYTDGYYIYSNGQYVWVSY